MNKLALAFLLFITLPYTSKTESYDSSENFASVCDQQDELASLRKLFMIPTDSNGNEVIYFCGHSLGLQPAATSTLMQEELNDWATMGVEGHFKDKSPWYSYHTIVRNSLARLVGAYPHEVVAMNSLTVNLHLMMASFYQPTPTRYKILMEAPVFSSDTYAVKSQIKFHGYNSDDALIIAQPREGENYLNMDDVERLLEADGQEIALILFSGVNYLSGQFVNIQRITKKGHAMGCLVGFDLAHTIGNVPLHLHEWDVDFAAWCSYKYLNAGPGAIGGVYVHEKHCRNVELNRFAGWWGNDPDTRFQLHLQPNFIPVPTADSWQLSNPSIFALVPLCASLAIFDTTNMQIFRKKSLKLTGYLEFLIDSIQSNRISLITPRNPEERGCQLSIQVDDQPEILMEKLREGGIVCDFRRPNILRVAPNPLYNTFHEVWQFVQIVKKHLE